MMIENRKKNKNEKKKKNKKAQVFFIKSPIFCTFVQSLGLFIMPPG